jgi:hypothetical protein
LEKESATNIKKEIEKLKENFKKEEKNNEKQK